MTDSPSAPSCRWPGTAGLVRNVSQGRPANYARRMPGLEGQIGHHRPRFLVDVHCGLEELDRREQGPQPVYGEMVTESMLAVPPAVVPVTRMVLVPAVRGTAMDALAQVSQLAVTG